MSKTVQFWLAQPYIVLAVTWCAYCGQRATVEIPSNPGRVCPTHAVEFWTGLLAYVHDHAGQWERKQKACACGPCKELSAARKLAAIAAAGPSPRIIDRVPIRRAS